MSWTICCIRLRFLSCFFILGDKIYLFKGETRGSFQRKKEVTFVVTSIEMCGYLRHWTWRRVCCDSTSSSCHQPVHAAPSSLEQPTKSTSSFNSSICAINCGDSPPPMTSSTWPKPQVCWNAARVRIREDVTWAVTQHFRFLPLIWTTLKRTVSAKSILTSQWLDNKRRPSIICHKDHIHFRKPTVRMLKSRQMKSVPLHLFHLFSHRAIASKCLELAACLIASSQFTVCVADSDKLSAHAHCSALFITTHLATQVRTYVCYAIAPPRDAAVLFAEAAKTEAVKEERNENEQGPYLRASRDQDHQPPDPPPHDDKPGCSKTVEQVSLTKPPLRKGVHSFFQCLCVI